MKKKPVKRETNGKEVKRDEGGRIVAGSAPLNPRGAPKRGQSWKEIYQSIGSLTPKEAADYCRAVAGKLASIGNEVTLREAVVLRVYAALLFDPDARLLNVVMDRDEGKVPQPHTIEPSEEALKLMRELGLTLEDVRRDPLAIEWLRLAGIEVEGIRESASLAGDTEADG